MGELIVFLIDEGSVFAATIVTVVAMIVALENLKRNSK